MYAPWNILRSQLCFTLILALVWETCKGASFNGNPKSNSDNIESVCSDSTTECGCYPIGKTEHKDRDMKGLEDFENLINILKCKVNESLEEFKQHKEYLSRSKGRPDSCSCKVNEKKLEKYMKKTPTSRNMNKFQNIIKEDSKCFEGWLAHLIEREPSTDTANKECCIYNDLKKITSEVAGRKYKKEKYKWLLPKETFQYLECHDTYLDSSLKYVEKMMNHYLKEKSGTTSKQVGDVRKQTTNKKHRKQKNRESTRNRRKGKGGKRNKKIRTGRKRERNTF